MLGSTVVIHNFMLRLVISSAGVVFVQICRSKRGRTQKYAKEQMSANERKFCEKKHGVGRYIEKFGLIT